MALGHRVAVGINMNGVIGTGLHTCFAADADIRVKLYDAVIALVHGLDGTNAHTRRVGTMVAACDLEMTPGVRICPGFHILDPGTVYP